MVPRVHILAFIDFFVTFLLCDFAKPCHSSPVVVKRTIPQPQGDKTMITNRKLLAFLALVLAFTVVSCSDPGRETNAEVRVVGTAVMRKSEKSRSVASDLQFDSGDVWLGGNDITSSLVPAEGSNATDGQNNVEFVAEVPVIGETVSYRVDPRDGFVFDEWEFVSRNEIRKGEGDNWWNVLNEIWQATRGDSETIEIRPEYIKYIRPSFDRGI